jgi:F0F1-type ATP synthase membrane subunit b/b'
MKTLLERINEKIHHFQTNAASHVDKANKAAGTRARKTSLEIEKELKEFRKKSMATQNSVQSAAKSGARSVQGAVRNVQGAVRGTMPKGR